MEIQRQMVGAVCALRPGGALVDADVASFRAAADEEIRRCGGRVVLDCSAVAFVDSAGLEALVDATERLDAAGRSLKLCAANATVRRVLELTGCAASFEFHEDVHAAVRSFL